MQVTPSCTLSQPCRIFRTCKRCAALRQSKIADKAESLSKTHGQLWVSTFSPEQNTPESIKALRGKLLRKGLAEFGLWTIETGEQFKKLHINTISTEPKLKLLEAHSGWSEPIKGNVRHVAAYISKPGAIPQTNQYSGRLYSAWGHISDYMLDQRSGPIIQAATINDIAMTWMERNSAEIKATKNKNFEDAAKRHLPALRDFLRSAQARRNG